LCTSFQFHCLLFRFFLFFVFCRGISLSGEVVLILAEGYHVTLGAHLLGLPKVSQACLDPTAGCDSSVGVAACLFSKCIMVWRRLPWAMVQGANV
jgi:hypothetical protein